MSMNIKDFPKGGYDIAPMEAGTYDAVCAGVIDIGTHTIDFNGESTEKDQLLILFEFPDETIEIDGETLPRNMTSKFSKSMNSKSNLRKTLIAWRGRDFTDIELGDFHLSKLIGAKATVSVAQREYNGKTSSYISAISKPMKANKAKESRKIFFEISDESTHNCVNFMPKWIIETINKSKEVLACGYVFEKQELNGAPLPHQQYQHPLEQSTNDEHIPF